MPKWLDTRDKDRKRGTGFDDRFEQLRLKVVTNSSGTPIAEDAKIAKIRFLTDVNDAESFWVHRLPKQTRLGKRFSVDVYCNTQDEKPCKYCESMDKDVARVSRKLAFWVYVYEILHARPDAEGEWERINYLNQTLYREPVNAPRLLYQGPGFNNSVENKFMNWEARFGTLCDRDYEWTRSGFTMNDTSYDLIPDVNGMSEALPEVVAVLENLPTMEDVVNSFREDTPDSREVSPSTTDPIIDEDLESLFG